MGGGGETGVVGSAATGAMKNQKAPPKIPRQLSNSNVLTTTIPMIATTDMPPALPEAGPAVAVPGCRLIPQCGQTSSLLWSGFEQEGQVFIAERYSIRRNAVEYAEMPLIGFPIHAR